MGQLDGKVAFITGAGSGIARAAARLFALEGAKVVIAELKPELGRASEAWVRTPAATPFSSKLTSPKKTASGTRSARRSPATASSTCSTTVPADRFRRTNR